MSKLSLILCTFGVTGSVAGLFLTVSINKQINQRSVWLLK